MSQSPGSPLDSLPPSAKLVYKVLEYHGPMTHGEIAQESRLPSRTVSAAIGRLEELELVTGLPSTSDARRTTYGVDNGER